MFAYPTILTASLRLALACVAIARQFGGQLQNFTGAHFWARGYAVSTVGYELEEVRRYMREQEGEDQAGRF